MGMGSAPCLVSVSARLRFGVLTKSGPDSSIQPRWNWGAICVCLVPSEYFPRPGERFACGGVLG